MQEITSSILGYDPGGNGKHGVAVLHVHNGQPQRLESRTLRTTEYVISLFSQQSNVTAIGIDTLTCWSTSKSGLRPADRWLRQRYPEVRSSVIAPNSLFGSMGLNGPAVLIALREMIPPMLVTETHPKVLWWHLATQPYDYAENRNRMNDLLANKLGVTVTTETEHEWDAALSAFVAYEGRTAARQIDLHRLPTERDERIVSPCGTTSYFWPK